MLLTYDAALLLCLLILLNALLDPLQVRRLRLFLQEHTLLA